MAQSEAKNVQTCHLELTHMHYRCAASVPQLFVEFGGIPNISGIPKEKSRSASSLANKESMPSHFFYACLNPRKLPANRNVLSRKQILQTFDVHEHHLALIKRHSNGPPKTMNRHKVFQNPKYKIDRLLSKKWPYYSFGGNRSPYH